MRRVTPSRSMTSAGPATGMVTAPGAGAAHAKPAFAGGIESCQAHTPHHYADPEGLPERFTFHSATREKPGMR